MPHPRDWTLDCRVKTDTECSMEPMDATVIGIPLASLSLEQLYQLRDRVNAEIARRQAPPPDVPGPMFGAT